MTCYRCGADYWDHAWYRSAARGRAIEVIRCAFCGALETQPCNAKEASQQAPPHAPDGAFVFDSGRFAGKPISEVAAHPSGKKYLAWALENVPKWSAPITEYLSHAAPSA
jgi:hypothetical protein